MSPGTSHALLTAAIIALIAWRLYGRIRRTIGRQHFSARRPWFLVVFFPLLLSLMVFAVHRYPLTEAALAVGVTLGVALGLLGLRLTRFEITPEGMFYTPSAHLGVALSTLLVGRIVYRFLVSGGAPWSGPGQPPAAPTPLTMLLLGTLAGYYTTYAFGLLRWAARSRSAAAPEVVPRTP